MGDEKEASIFEIIGNLIALLFLILCFIYGFRFLELVSRGAIQWN